MLIGQPVENCNTANGSQTTKTKLGGTYELQHSFSVEGGGHGSLVVLKVLGIDVGGTVTKGKQEKIARSQEIEVEIPAGKIVSHDQITSNAKIHVFSLVFVGSCGREDRLHRTARFNKNR
jgi:hypothetical protein